MKKLLSSLALVLCCCLSAFSQATSLTVDCQNPGWLSSKIGYSDQQSVTDLTITGYLNSTDFEFIGTLMKLHSLKRLNLEQVDVVASDANAQNVLPLNMFKIEWPYQPHLEKVALPLSVTRFSQSATAGEVGCFSSNLYVDTLVIGGSAMPTIQNSIYGKSTSGGSCFSSKIKCLIIRDGVESIEDYCFQNNSTSDENILQRIIFPSTLKTIGKYAFYYCKSIETLDLPNSLEEIQIDAFTNTSWNPDTLVLPSSLKNFYVAAFNSPSNVYYYPSSIQYIDNTRRVYYTNLHEYGDKDLTINTKIEIHIEKTTPPKIKYGTVNTFNQATIYVPKGSAEQYRTTIPWDKARIIEDIHVEGISLDASKSLYVGEEAKLQAQIIPSNALNIIVKWGSSNPEVVGAFDDGTIKAIAYGTADITATTEDGGYEAICTVNVYEHTTGVEMVNTISVPIDKTYTLGAKTLPLATSDGKVSFSSDNPDIASVDEKGVVIGKKKGSCTITATSVDGGHTATCEVTVTQPVEALTLEKHSVSLKVGETEKLFTQITPTTADDKTIAWSSDGQIASVDASGNVSALKAGEVWVKAVSKDNAEAKDSCKVIVIQPVTGVSLSKESITFDNAAESTELTATIVPEDASNKDVRWSSSNENVCVVNNGLVTAVAAGTATVTVTTVDGGFTANCIVKVVQHVATVELNKSSTSLKVGETEKLLATISPDNADNKKVLWSSGDSELVSVDAEGNITALNAGEVTITATSEDNPNAKATCKVMVIQPATGITLSESSYTLTGIGQSVQLTATVLPEDATNKNVKWKSSNESVCIVSNGQVVAVGEGICVIIATAEDGGFMATCTVTVSDATAISSLKADDGCNIQVFDINGTQLSGLKRGINIIRFADGTKKKVFVK